jgi:orotidine-5'-phosphate decarboxylase
MMSDNFADRLLDAIAAKGSPVCVGLDPTYDKLPDELKKLAPLRAFVEFCRAIIEASASVVPAVKPQIAYFERYGHAGVAAYEEVVRLARSAGLIVIGDVKRNDIGSTAAEYAAGHLGAADGPDAITINGYFGADGIQPFVDAAKAAGKGLFVLVRTSNPSAAAIQDFADASGRKFYEHMAQQVSALGEQEGLIGRRGYSCLGAVVGATWPGEAKALRQIMPRQLFLVPGYGAQGATAKDCAAAFKPDGAGAIVNASRSVIYAFHDKKYAGMEWKKAIGEAARAFARDIGEAVRQ